MPNIITTDKLLSGQVVLRQLQGSYRVGIDAVLLASMVTLDEQADLKILDLGAGVGGVSLCILKRLSTVRVVSIERIPAYYELCCENIKLNAFVKNRYEAHLGEIADFKDLFGHFDVVVANPPYYRQNECREAHSKLKSLAHIETTATLKDFLDLSYKYLKPKGKLHVVHKSCRLPELLCSKYPWGDIVINPLFSYADSHVAERVIVSLRKDSKQDTKLTSGIVIHNSDGSYTARADAIINGGKSFLTSL